jgi:NAD(P)-dependent dehydrogenase (short-subunit alcohol dehydrogenase family)
MDLEGRIAVVTGGAQGIGQATCLRLAQAGVRIAMLDLTEPGETRELLARAGADAWHAETDVADERSVTEAFARLEADWGTPAVLVNVAGVFADVAFLDTPVDVWERMMAVNARGVFLCSQAAARRMARAGEGRIVNVLSTASFQGFALESAYCASKGAALLLTKVMAVELAPLGIAVNAVAPGTVRTAMGSAYLGGGPIAGHELQRTPLGRLGEPEDIAEAIAFLAGPASWMTGEVLCVDGGFLAAGLPVLPALEAITPVPAPAPAAAAPGAR